mgnify:FL=1
MKNKKSYPSIISLIIANSIPLIGVLFFDWSLIQILLLYWFESAIIGFYTILKIIKANKTISFFLVPFFILHYGGFMFGHLAFIFAFFRGESVGTTLLWNSAPAILTLFISHGISFFSNFLGKREYKNTNLQEQMVIPYKRIIAMHFTLILGGFLISIYNSPVFALIILIIAKIIIDLRSHIKEHKNLNT